LTIECRRRSGQKENNYDQPINSRTHLYLQNVNADIEIYDILFDGASQTIESGGATVPKDGILSRACLPRPRGEMGLHGVVKERPADEAKDRESPAIYLAKPVWDDLIRGETAK
jgi:hypothetical protein